MTPTTLVLTFVVVIASLGRLSARLNPWDSIIRLPEEGDELTGTRWAVLVAGSNGFANYRHQADVCHAYQLLRRGGLREENIVVFMYDDIAMHEYNPRPGVIINHPQGEDVYAGVPKDYTGDDVTVDNLFAVLLGDRSESKGGSGKVVNSTSQDRIFLYYSDHGGPGVLGMPNLPFLFANDFIDVLKKKHSRNSYKEMVMYIEACESGSIFEGMLPENLNIYVTTASNAEESSWGTYCPGMDPPPPPEYMTCLGDLYSVSWMEDSENHNLMKETIKQQYHSVRERTSNYNSYFGGSHVMEYGSRDMKEEKLYLYQGFDPATANFPPNEFHHKMGVINQRDADMLFLWQIYKKEKRIGKREQILGEIKEIVGHRTHLDSAIEMIGAMLFGERWSLVLSSTRAPGLPLVDDWIGLKQMVRVFESYCGLLTQYGMRHVRALANIINAGVSVSAMEEASAAACSGHVNETWSPLIRGYSAGYL